MPDIDQTDIGSFVGSWRLLSFNLVFTDTRESLQPMGGDPVGAMTLSASGRIMFLFGKPDRERASSDNDKIRLYDSMAAYTGIVCQKGDKFVITVDFSHDPAFKGEQTRFLTLDGEHLEIRTPEQVVPMFGGRPLIGNLRWVREHHMV